VKGTVALRELHSPSLENNPLGDPARRQVAVYLPFGHGQGDARFPTVYFLHGFTGSVHGWLNVSAFTPNVPERIDGLIGSGTVPPFIGVFVDGWTSLGGSQWINSDGIGRYQTYLARDVVAWADRELRTIPRGAARAIVGKSSGGYGALAMARTQPDVFAHVGCHSGDAYFEYCYMPDFGKAAAALLKAGGVEAWFREFVRRAADTKMGRDDHDTVDAIAMSAAYSPKKGEPLNLELPFELPTGRLRSDVWNRWLSHDPVRFVPKHIDQFKKLKSLFIDCGSRDEHNLRWGARIISEELTEGGVEHIHEEFDDGHMMINYRYDRSLTYLVPRLARD
jgi:S-formylglutathione hydrolase FrmB